MRMGYLSSTRIGLLHGLPFMAHGLPFMAPFIAQGFSAAYAEEAAIIATTPNIANISSFRFSSER